MYQDQLHSELYPYRRNSNDLRPIRGHGCSSSNQGRFVGYNLPRVQ